MVHSLSHLLRTPLRIVATALLLFAAQAVPAWSTLSQFIFQATTGTPNDMSGATVLLNSGVDDAIATPTAIGFNFTYDGTTYTTFSASSNGFTYLGSNSNNTYNNCQATFQSTPRLMLLERDNYTIGNGVRYKLTGSVGSRVLTIDWEIQPLSTSLATNFQLRLYEGTNNIEYWYGSSTVPATTTFYIGLNNNANSSYLGIVSGAASSSTSCTQTPNPANGTLYRFIACGTSATGDVSQGGTSAMNDNDAILANVSATVGTSTSRQPFSLSQLGAFCSGSGTVTYSITGPSASEYSITPNPGTLPATPTINFTPTSVGVRSAQLRVTSVGFVRTYSLSAVGIPQINLVGNVAQGGTSPLRDGDTLFRNIFLAVGQSQIFEPVTLTNTSSSPASYSVSLVGGGAEYSMLPVSGTLSPGQSLTPPITFSPADTGTRQAILNITSDGRTTSYRLYGFGAYSRISFALNGGSADTNSAFFTMQYGCVGGEFITIPLDVSASGGVDVNLLSLKAYEVDTTVRQGAPSYPLRRDQFGNLIPAGDYIVTSAPPTLPFTPATVLQLPYSMPNGSTTRLYLSFIANRPGKRFARVYIQTDGLNFAAADEHGNLSSGLFRFDVYGRARAASLTDTKVPTKRPQPVNLGEVRLGDRTTRWVPITNRGECELMIDSRYLRTDLGDVEELKFEGASATFARSADSNFLMLAAGATDSLLVSFSPKQVGSRYAELYLRTNDSALATAGTPEHGVYRIGLFGTGATGLYLTMEGADLGLGVIGDSAGPFAHGVVRMVNNSNAVIAVTGLELRGADSADFHAATPAWPGLPFNVPPGGTVDLGVEFRPTGGSAGAREAAVMATTSTGQEVRATLTAIAGVRSLVVNPEAVAFPTARAGRVVRRTVMVQNQGTVPVVVSSITITGADAADFQVSPLVRPMLAPGQTEFLEVSFSRTTAGSSSALLNIVASTGTVEVPLTASASLSRYKDDDPSGATIGDGGKDAPNTDGTEYGLAGVATERGVSTLAVSPNPVSGGEVVVSYRLVRDGAVRVELVNAAGVVVGSVERSGVVAGVEQREGFAVAGLGSGVYLLRLVTVEGVAVRSLVIAR